MAALLLPRGVEDLISSFARSHRRARAIEDVSVDRYVANEGMAKKGQGDCGGCEGWGYPGGMAGREPAAD